MTDGRSNDESVTWRESRSSRDQGITILPVAIGNNVREIELQGMASDPIDNNIIRAADFMSLNNIKNALLNAVCNG